ncbi:MAG TPA: cobalt transporter CbiM [Verrucomicrobiae bacterium]|nr:cobalt transporter CbiM [Verrucomicrobiae bacterium]
MHIPDGYLSPSTCAAMYAAASPFWYASLRRLRGLLRSRLIPLVSLFSAFSFVVMMFNLPLPGGTTGHAVGVSIASIVLGPWGSILAISVALIIQALFFGDGGITALGANCFNMAIAGSLVAYAIYRLVSRNSSIASARRVAAAGIAGYAAINVSALLAAVEFGIQPILFRDAMGAPLYAPYPLKIAVPAMMAGHLTIAGLAELILSAGLVAWLQRSHPSLLRMTAPNAVEKDDVAAGFGRPAMRTMLIGLAILLLCTPLGILAIGSAWGEWSATDLANPATRQQIAVVSANQAPPAAVPQGLQRLSSIWTAPFPAYAPPFLRSASFGYMLSATFGVGLILLIAAIADRLFARLRGGG